MQTESEIYTNTKFQKNKMSFNYHIYKTIYHYWVTKYICYPMTCVLLLRKNLALWGILASLKMQPHSNESPLYGYSLHHQLMAHPLRLALLLTPDLFVRGNLGIRSDKGNPYVQDLRKIFGKHSQTPVS